METSSHRPLKIYFLPYLAAGHMTPMLNLARVFAFHGHHVTILTTPSNAPKGGGTHGGVIHSITFNLPYDQVGLPRGLENLSAATDNDTAVKLGKACNLLQPEIEAFVEQNPPDAVVVDIMFAWSCCFSLLGIPTFVFKVMPIFVSCVVDSIRRRRKEKEIANLDYYDNSSSFAAPGERDDGDLLPHGVTLNVNPLPGLEIMAHLLLHVKHKSYSGVIVNSFAEIEGDRYTEYYENLTGLKVWHIGFSSLMLDFCISEGNPTCQTLAQEEEDHGPQHECLAWLNSKEPCSVVYICFGSLYRLSNKQLYEIACGIEASGHAFLWVVPKKKTEEEEEEEEEREKSSWLPEGFEERMILKEKRGVILRGWAPQALILKNPAVGGFFTHCGWNSVAEAVAAGVPMITMPGFSDQFYKEKLVTEVHGIGVEAGEGYEWTMSPYDERKKVVSKERIEEAVRKVMAAADGGVRERAKEMQEKARRAVQKGGSSFNNLNALIQTLQQLSLDKVKAS